MLNAGDPPRALVCPITQTILLDPVIDENGHTFERSAIEAAWLRRPGVSPITNAPYPDGGVSRLLPNRALRDTVDIFLESSGEACIYFPFWHCVTLSFHIHAYIVHACTYVGEAPEHCVWCVSLPS